MDITYLLRSQEPGGSWTRRFVGGVEQSVEEALGHGLIESPWVSWDEATRVLRVERDCYGAIEYDWDDGTVTEEPPMGCGGGGGADAGPATDAGRTDGGTVSGDGGTVPGDGAAGGGSGPPGCACSAGGRQHAPGWAAVMAAIGLLLAACGRARRRRSGGH